MHDSNMGGPSKRHNHVKDIPPLLKASRHDISKRPQMLGTGKYLQDLDSGRRVRDTALTWLLRNLLTGLSYTDTTLSLR
jgi:hypothetical protein